VKWDLVPGLVLGTVSGLVPGQFNVKCVRSRVRPHLTNSRTIAMVSFLGGT